MLSPPKKPNRSDSSKQLHHPLVGRRPLPRPARPERQRNRDLAARADAQRPLRPDRARRQQRCRTTTRRKGRSRCRGRGIDGGAGGAGAGAAGGGRGGDRRAAAAEGSDSAEGWREEEEERGISPGARSPPTGPRGRTSAPLLGTPSEVGSTEGLREREPLLLLGLLLRLLQLLLSRLLWGPRRARCSPNSERFCKKKFFLSL